MVRHFYEGKGQSEQKIAQLAGLLAATQALFRCLTSYFWGIVLDKLGKARGLAERMTATDPDERPSASECIEIFERLASRINPRNPVVVRRSWDERSNLFRFIRKRFVASLMIW